MNTSTKLYPERKSGHITEVEFILKTIPNYYSRIDYEVLHLVGYVAISKFQHVFSFVSWEMGK